MRVVLFYHSLVSDWNHGNAHFLRGVISELMARGHQVDVYEPRDGWSVHHLRTYHGAEAIDRFYTVYPHLSSVRYDPESLDLEKALDQTDLVIVHEWNEHDLVSQIGHHRARQGKYRLLFHDTHHRSLSDEANIATYDLSNYDGVLAFGEVIRQRYLAQGWANRAWTWHEAADTRLFYPRRAPKEGDLIWIGNWGDDERTAELYTFLFKPVQELGLKAVVHGVRYPQQALDDLAAMQIEYRGWLPNFDVPEQFARFRVTVHVPRRPYVETLPGIPTIRPFEALACGIPLVSAPWDDAEHLFTPGKDFLVARTGDEMKSYLHDLLHDPSLAEEITTHGLDTIRARHTCAHRVDELMAICEELGVGDKVTG
jgi:spore maturation protein CgeB